MITIKKSSSIHNLLQYYPLLSVQKRKDRLILALSSFSIGFLLLFIQSLLYLAEANIYFKVVLHPNIPTVFSLMNAFFLVGIVSFTFLRGAMIHLFQKVYCDFGILFFSIQLGLGMLVPGFGIYVIINPYQDAFVNIWVFIPLLYLIPFIYTLAHQLKTLMLKGMVWMYITLVSLCVLLTGFILFQSTLIQIQLVVIQQVVHSVTQASNLFEMIQATQYTIKQASAIHALLMYIISLTFIVLSIMIIVQHKQLYPGFYRIKTLLRAVYSKPTDLQPLVPTATHTV